MSFTTLSQTSSEAKESEIDTCYSLDEARQIMKAIEELKISRQQLVIRDNIIKSYKTQVDFYVPALTEQKIINSDLVNQLNERDDKISDLRRNRLAYAVAGAVLGAVLYAIIVK